MISKTCSKCHFTKDVEDFCNDKNRKDGKYPQCRSCRSDGSKSRSKSNSARELITVPVEKRCPKCKSVKTSDQFDRCRSKPDGLKGICKVCCRDWVNLKTIR